MIIRVGTVNNPADTLVGQATLMTSLTLRLEISPRNAVKGVCLSHKSRAEHILIERHTGQTQRNPLEIYCRQARDFGILTERKQDRFRLEPNYEHGLHTRGVSRKQKLSNIPYDQTDCHYDDCGVV